jgi:hypothetical protein
MKWVVSSRFFVGQIVPHNQAPYRIVQALAGRSGGFLGTASAHPRLAGSE